MVNKPHPDREKAEPGYSFGVKLGLEGMSHLLHLKAMMEGEQLGPESLSRGEVIRRALRQCLLAELCRRADPDTEGDPYTHEWLMVYLGDEYKAEDSALESHPLALAAWEAARRGIPKKKGKRGTK